MRSTRLPGKILLPIPLNNGKPLLNWIIDELKLSKLDKEIIVATSKNEENDVLEAFCIQNKIQCFRGDEDDVLSRFNKIIEKKNFDCVVRLTADNPFIDISILEKTVCCHFESGNDYTKTDALPLGMNFEVVSTTALKGLKEQIITESDREHVTLFIRNNDKYKKGIYKPLVSDELKDLRLTIDYPSDFTLASAILSQHHTQNVDKGIKLIERMYKEYKWLFESNASNIQKRQYLNIDEEMNAACIFLENHDYKHAAKLLKRNAK